MFLIPRMERSRYPGVLFLTTRWNVYIARVLPGSALATMPIWDSVPDTPMKFR